MGKNQKRKSQLAFSDSSQQHHQKRLHLSAAEGLENESDSDGLEDLPTHRGGGFSKPKPSSYGRPDPTTGMRSAFPGLDDGDVDNDELFYGPASDGLEYLRMVRSEAKGVPSLLVAAQDKQNIQEKNLRASEAQSKSFYSDGAYTSVLSPAPQQQPTPASLVSSPHRAAPAADPQTLYHQSLLLRFRLLRANLRVTPERPPALLSPSGESSTTLPGGPSSKHTYAMWRSQLLQHAPTPLQLASLPQTTVLKLLRLIGTSLLRVRKPIGKELGAWIWGLLGRLEEVGCLGSTEVGVVRDMGKRAAWVLEHWGNLAGELPIADEESDILAEEEQHQEPDPEKYKTNANIEEEAEEDEENEEGEGEGEGERKTEEIKYETRRQSRRNSSSPLPNQVDTLGQPPTSTEAVELEDGEVEEETSAQAAPYETEEELDTDVATAAALAAHKSRLLLQLSPETITAHDTGPDQATMATLDMVLTIVGEAYGQRDLLDSRAGCWSR